MAARRSWPAPVRYLTITATPSFIQAAMTGTRELLFSILANFPSCPYFKKSLSGRPAIKPLHVAIPPPQLDGKQFSEAPAAPSMFHPLSALGLGLSYDAAYPIGMLHGLG